jgi:hypothetical protein
MYYTYSLYDVIYLPELLKKFINMNIIYKKLIPEITCVINSYKRNIDTKFNEIEELINKMNIYFIKKHNNIIYLKDLFQNTKLHNITEINYFKKFLITIYRLFIYNDIMKNNTIYKNNKEEFKTNKLIQYIEWIKKHKYIYDIITK